MLSSVPHSSPFCGALNMYGSPVCGLRLPLAQHQAEIRIRLDVQLGSLGPHLLEPLPLPLEGGTRAWPERYIHLE